jgi:hypothetical protein
MMPHATSFLPGDDGFSKCFLLRFCSSKEATFSLLLNRYLSNLHWHEPLWHHDTLKLGALIKGQRKIISTRFSSGFIILNMLLSMKTNITVLPARHWLFKTSSRRNTTSRSATKYVTRTCCYWY